MALVVCVHRIPSGTLESFLSLTAGIQSIDFAGYQLRETVEYKIDL